MSNEPDYSIIIPTLNEEEAIADVLKRIPREIWQNGEVIVVDASSDNTAFIARDHGARVIHSPKKGKGKQISDGVQNAQGRIIVMMDGDGEHPPEYIPELIYKLDENYDVVLGTRNNLSFIKYPLLSIFYLFYLPMIKGMFKASGVEFEGTPLSGFRCMKKTLWKKLHPETDDFLLETEMNIKIGEHGLRHGEVHIPYVERYNGILNSRVVKSGAAKQIVGYLVSYVIQKKVKDKMESTFQDAQERVVAQLKVNLMKIMDTFLHN
jgi:glycosyltransferase involved in cell wall biosynthesis